MAEGVDSRSVSDFDTRAEHDMRFDRHIAPEPGIVGEPHAFRIDQGRAFVERLLAPPALPFEFEVGELGAAIDARRLERLALDVDLDRQIPECAIEVGGSRAIGGHQQMGVTQQHHMGARFLRRGQELGKDRRIVDSVRRASRIAGLNRYPCASVQPSAVRNS